jgi:hypothetical protein
MNIVSKRQSKNHNLNPTRLLVNAKNKKANLLGNTSKDWLDKFVK